MLITIFSISFELGCEQHIQQHKNYTREFLPASGKFSLLSLSTWLYDGPLTFISLHTFANIASGD